jgi:pyruvate,orthophosphate dikinase
VIVQAMVFGNGNALSGSGVAFTRDPATGRDEMCVDFLFNAQGEDVVSGRRAIRASADVFGILPEAGAGLLRARTLLESEFKDMQDVEFTVQDGRLYFLQSRAGKRTPWAALQIAVDLHRAGLITPAEVASRLAPYDLDSIRRERIAADQPVDVIAHATPASLGVASGAIAFDRSRAIALAATTPVVLVRRDLTTDDVGALAAAAGVLTALGGRTSHAAVVARHLGKVCLVGCETLRVDEARRVCTFGSRAFAEGDRLTLDGETGLVYAGAVTTVVERPEAALAELARILPCRIRV